MKQFTHRNEGFVCEVCGHQTPDAVGTCRNHCTACLHSKHVDKNPGDRANACQGILEPVGLELKNSLPDKILFTCQKCGFNGRNKVAEDDDKTALMNLLDQF